MGRYVVGRKWMFNGVKLSGWLDVEAIVHVDNIGTVHTCVSGVWRSAIKIAQLNKNHDTDRILPSNHAFT